MIERDQEIKIERVSGEGRRGVGGGAQAGSQARMIHSSPIISLPKIH